MRRVCNGEDPNLIAFVDRETGEKRAKALPNETQDSKPCDCGRVFDDTQRRVIWPHEFL